MAELRKLGYAWRENNPDFIFSDKVAIETAVQQLIDQVRTLPPGSIVVTPAEIRYLGEVELDDPTAPKDQYLLYTSYNVPVY